MSKRNILTFCVIFVIVLVGILLMVGINNKRKNIKEYTNFVRTYYVLKMEVGVDPNKVDLLVEEYNSEEATTVSVARNLLEDGIIEGEAYEFTFDYKGEAINDTTEEIFNKMSLKNVRLTTKQGFEQRQDSL